MIVAVFVPVLSKSEGKEKNSKPEVKTDAAETLTEGSMRTKIRMVMRIIESLEVLREIFITLSLFFVVYKYHLLLSSPGTFRFNKLQVVLVLVFGIIVFLLNSDIGLAISTQYISHLSLFIDYSSIYGLSSFLFKSP